MLYSAIQGDEVGFLGFGEFGSTQPDAVLTRTNAGAVHELMALQDLGFNATLRSDPQSITTLLLAAAGPDGNNSPSRWAVER